MEDLGDDVKLETVRLVAIKFCKSSADEIGSVEENLMLHAASLSEHGPPDTEDN
jgi:hypothetical protein